MSDSASSLLGIRALPDVGLPSWGDNRLKQWRGIATRSDKTARSYLAGVTCAAALIWIRSGLSNRSWWRPPHSSHTARSRSWVSACWDGGPLTVTLSRTTSVLVTVRLTDNAQQVALAAGKRGRSRRCSQDSCTCNSANGTRSASHSDSSSASVEAHPNHGRCGMDRPDVKILEMAWSLGPQLVGATTTQLPKMLIAAR